jgi:hypothetical protein
VRSRRIAAWCAGAIAIAVASSSCIEGGGGDADGAGGTFIAFASNFTGYRGWEHVPGESPNPPLSTHTMGPRTVYINAMPPAGSKTFPVGTVIVKELEEGAIGERQVFAMVKRGGGYNTKGATDWEWFELQNVDETNVKILWHGVGPPAGEMYGGDPNGGCNGCHGAARANDFVQTTGLQLDSIQ